MKPLNQSDLLGLVLEVGRLDNSNAKTLEEQFAAQSAARRAQQNRRARVEYQLKWALNNRGGIAPRANRTPIALLPDRS
jgi:hypothetical protein